MLDETAEDEEDRPLPVEDLTEDVGEMPFDLRIKIQVSDRSRKERSFRDGSLAPAYISQLDIISGVMHLTDCFEWDIQSDITPEQFAEVYASDLGLNGEFKSVTE